jgi:hypothetical protein
MKTTFFIIEGSKSFMINLRQDKDFRLEYFDLETPFSYIRLKFMFSEIGLDQIRKALEPYDEDEETQILDFIQIGNGKYSLEVVFKLDQCSIYFNTITKEGTIKLKKEEAEYLKRSLSRKPDNK